MEGNFQMWVPEDILGIYKESPVFDPIERDLSAAEQLVVDLLQLGWSLSNILLHVGPEINHELRMVLSGDYEWITETEIDKAKPVQFILLYGIAQTKSMINLINLLTRLKPLLVENGRIFCDVLFSENAYHLHKGDDDPVNHLARHNQVSFIKQCRANGMDLIVTPHLTGVSNWCLIW